MGKGCRQLQSEEVFVRLILSFGLSEAVRVGNGKYRGTNEAVYSEL
jgi:hypothetical protein